MLQFKLEEWGEMVVLSILEMSQPKSSEELGGFRGAWNWSSRSDVRFPTGGKTLNSDIDDDIKARNTAVQFLASRTWAEMKMGE
jgi:hypothetical protein